MAFGARYDGNPDVAFVDIRDYGNSGDCNGDYAGIRNTTLYSFQSNFIAPHVQAVQKTQLIIPWTGAWLEGKPADPVCVCAPLAPGSQIAKATSPGRAKCAPPTALQRSGTMAS